MDNIKDIVKNVMGNMTKESSLKHEKIERLWQNVVNPQELKHTRFVGIKEGKIFVNVDSSAWLYQMNIKKNRILERLKEEISEIKEIRFTLGKI